MPNLKPPVTSAAQAIAYRARILDALPAGAAFEPLMTLYLTDSLAPAGYSFTPTMPADFARAISAGGSWSVR